MEGPHLVSPSLQRAPVLFQAGSSKAGRDFGARNAEAVFIGTPDPKSASKLINDTPRLAIQYGRNAGDICFYQGLSFVIGENEEEARRKEIELEIKWIWI